MALPTKKIRAVDPLQHDVPIVDRQGRPTPLFMRQWVAARSATSTTQEIVEGHKHNAADITEGVFNDDLISESSVTQHQGALSISAAQITAGVFADAATYTFQHHLIVNGNIAVGTSVNTGVALRLIKEMVSGSTSQYGMSSNVTYSSSATTAGRGYYSSGGTAAAPYVMAHMQHFFADNATVGAGSTITNQYGFYIPSVFNAATNNWGVYIAAPIPSYFGGAVRLGENAGSFSAGNPHLEISSITGTDVITPTNARIRTRSSASNWSTVDPWGTIEFWSDDSSGGAAGVRAKIGAMYETAAGSTTSLVFWTGSGAGVSEAGRFSSGGGFSALGYTHIFGGGGAGRTTVSLNSAAGQNRDLRWLSAGVDRWQARVTSTAEAGANVGSNWQLLAFDDVGVSLGAALDVTRATLAVGFIGNLSVGLTTSTSREINIRAAAGSNRTIRFSTANSNRWAFLADSSAEAGANAGSDFLINAYNDAGATIGQALKIVRATMAATFGLTVSATGFLVGANQVVGARKAGWATATGTATRTTFDTAAVTLPQLAERVKALIDDLYAGAGHGLIGA